MTAQLGKLSLTGRSGQASLDRSAWKDQPGQGSLNRSAWKGRNGKDRRDKSAETGHPGQVSQEQGQFSLDRSDCQVSLDRSALTGQPERLA